MDTVRGNRRKGGRRFEVRGWAPTCSIMLPTGTRAESRKYMAIRLIGCNKKRSLPNGGNLFAARVQ